MQLVETQTQLEAAQQELELVTTEADTQILRLECEDKQLEKQAVIVSNADVPQFNEPDNRLLRQCLARKVTTNTQDQLVGAVVHFPVSSWSITTAALVSHALVQSEIVNVYRKKYLGYRNTSWTADCKAAATAA